MSGYTEYQPNGDCLSFRRDIPGDPPNSEVLFADTIRALDHLAGVVRPTTVDLWLTCALEDTWVDIDEVEPSELYWQLLRGNVPAATTFPPAGPPATTVRLPELSGEALRNVYRQALDRATCPDGYFVMFKIIWTDRFETRIVDANESATGDQFRVKVWGDDHTLTTFSAADGTTWLAPPPAGFPARPPVEFRIDYDAIGPFLTLSVNWSRWLDKGTGEHQLLQSALDALVADGWESTQTPSYFTLPATRRR